ncbi:hypothetical protein ACJEHO_08680 [Legionella pneumophila]|uniref:hypothetical protein n=1 Tax=Legionella pneumophila TaxID=446 RepID=UPI0038B45F07
MLEVKNFFDLNIDNEYNQLLDRLKEATGLTKDIQNKINRLDNLIAYRTHAKDNEIKEEINRLLADSAPYSDLTVNAAYNSFPANYQSKVFELAIFNYLKSTQNLSLSLRDNPQPPDFTFLHDSYQHQVECVTRTSSLMDNFLKMLPDFNKFLAISYILKKANQNRIDLYQSGFDCIFSEPAIKVLFSELLCMESDQIKVILQVSTLKMAEETFIDWTYVLRYAYLFFIDCLPDGIIIELEKIDFPRSLCGDQTHDKKTNDFMLNGIINAISDKAKKTYFREQNKPITLAISFALTRNFISVPNPANIMEIISQKLKQVVSESYINSENNYFQNLYAIIIDTCWYNWFPKIATKRHNAQFPNGFNNCYGCIYNREHFLSRSGQYIYDRIPYIGYF